MDSKGALSVKPVRQSRRVAILAGVWLAVILVLGFWWASIVLRQSERIAELSQRAGIPQAEALAELDRTQRMLQWESSTFLVLLLIHLGRAVLVLPPRHAARARHAGVLRSADA